MSVSLEETIAKLDEVRKRGILGICGIKISYILKLLRELQERRKQPEIVHCKDCAHYHTDVFGGELGLTGIWENIIVAHNACDKWTKDMNCVDPDGFCFFWRKGE
jgi:hypothetical protein